MANSTRVRLSDMRKVYRLLGEIVEMGHDPDVWRSHLAQGMLKLFELQNCHVYVMPYPVTAANANVGQIHMCGLDDAGIRLWMEYGRRGDLTADPCTPEIMRRMNRPFTAVRTELVADRAWYKSSYYNGFKRQTRSDDLLVSIVPLPQIGILHGLGGDRVRGSRPMGRREIICCNLLHSELARLWRRSFAESARIRNALSPRLAQLLEHLRGPKSEKEIAIDVGLSHHTIHNHIRRLYARLHVSSRPELMAMDNQRRRLAGPRLGVAGL